MPLSPFYTYLLLLPISMSEPTSEKFDACFTSPADERRLACSHVLNDETISKDEQAILRLSRSAAAAIQHDTQQAITDLKANISTGQRVAASHFRTGLVYGQLKFGAQMVRHFQEADNSGYDFSGLKQAIGFTANKSSEFDPEFEKHLLTMTQRHR